MHFLFTVFCTLLPFSLYFFLQNPVVPHSLFKVWTSRNHLHSNLPLPFSTVPSFVTFFERHLRSLVSVAMSTTWFFSIWAGMQSNWVMSHWQARRRSNWNFPAPSGTSTSLATFTFVSSSTLVKTSLRKIQSPRPTHTGSGWQMMSLDPCAIWVCVNAWDNQAMTWDALGKANGSPYCVQLHRRKTKARTSPAMRTWVQWLTSPTSTERQTGSWPSCSKVIRFMMQVNLLVTLSQRGVLSCSIFHHKAMDYRSDLILVILPKPVCNTLKIPTSRIVKKGEWCCAMTSTLNSEMGVTAWTVW